MSFQSAGVLLLGEPSFLSPPRPSFRLSSLLVFTLGDLKGKTHSNTTTTWRLLFEPCAWFQKGYHFSLHRLSWDHKNCCHFFFLEFKVNKKSGHVRKVDEAVFTWEEELASPSDSLEMWTTGHLKTKKQKQSWQSHHRQHSELEIEQYRFKWVFPSSPYIGLWENFFLVQINWPPEAEAWITWSHWPSGSLFKIEGH